MKPCKVDGCLAMAASYITVPFFGVPDALKLPLCDEHLELIERRKFVEPLIITVASLDDTEPMIDCEIYRVPEPPA